MNDQVSHLIIVLQKVSRSLEDKTPLRANEGAQNMVGGEIAQQGT